LLGKFGANNNVNSGIGLNRITSGTGDKNSNRFQQNGILPSFNNNRIINSGSGSSFNIPSSSSLGGSINIGQNSYNTNGINIYSNSLHPSRTNGVIMDHHSNFARVKPCIPFQPCFNKVLVVG
jgi:hypothetical protein